MLWPLPRQPGGPTPWTHLAPHSLSLPVQGSGHIYLLHVLQVRVEDKADPALHTVRAVWGQVWAQQRTWWQTQGPLPRDRGIPASTSMPLSKAAKNFSPSNISTVSEGSGPRYRSSSRCRVASTWVAPLAQSPKPRAPSQALGTYPAALWTPVPPCLGAGTAAGPAQGPGASAAR